MAENLWTNNPFMRMFNEMSAPWCSTFKQTAAQYINAGEKWAQQALELNENITAWAKETPFAPVFETQHAVVRQMVETSTALARRLWQIETRADDTAAV